MNKVRLIIIAIMIAMCVMLVSADSCTGTMTAGFVWSKIIGFAMMPTIYILYRYWDSRGLLGKDEEEGEL